MLIYRFSLRTCKKPLSKEELHCFENVEAAASTCHVDLTITFGVFMMLW